MKSCITYHIDKERRISFVNDNWHSFAIENGAGELTRNAILDKPIYDFITDESCRHIYEMLIERCEKSKEMLVLSFRCDSPVKRRFMLMEIFPLKNESTGFKSCIIKEQNRDTVEFLDRNTKRSEEFMKICSWCKKVEVDERFWVEVEEAIEHLGLFGVSPLPQLTHGICPTCLQYVKRKWSR